MKIWLSLRLPSQAPPNPLTPNANALGQITLTWSAPGVDSVEIHVCSAHGTRRLRGFRGDRPVGQ
jgi:hypothetical protein